MAKRRTEKSRFREKHPGLPASEVEALWRLWRLKNEAFHDLSAAYHDYLAFARERHEADDTPVLARRTLELVAPFSRMFNRIVSPCRAAPTARRKFRESWVKQATLSA